MGAQLLRRRSILRGDPSKYAPTDDSHFYRFEQTKNLYLLPVVATNVKDYYAAG
jgi:hypothetical protein